MIPAGRASAFVQYLTQLAIVAVAYYVTADLTQLLTLPPGFATPVWPAAGLAIAALLFAGYNLWPGIFLGAFVHNIGNYEPTVQGLAMVTVVAAGATMQALAGTALVHLCTRLSTALEEVRDIVALLLLGGVVACVISPTVGTVTLYLAGKVEWAHFPSVWLTWWVGDVIGVAVFAPLILLLLAPPVTVSLSRKLMMAVILATIFGSVLYLFYATREFARQARVSGFALAVSDVTDGLDRAFEEYQSTLRNTDALFAASEEVTEAEYLHFTSRQLQRSPEMTAVLWYPRITHAERAEYERSMSASTAVPLSITERGADLQLQPAAQRDVYFPLTYIGSAAPVSFVRGLDIYQASTPGVQVRRTAMDTALRSGETVMTPMLGITSIAIDQAVMIFNPVYNIKDSGLPVTERRVRGFVVAVLSLPDIFRGWRTRLEKSDILFTVEDVTDPSASWVIYAATMSKPGDLTMVRDFSIAQRIWRVTFFQSATPSLTVEGWLLWIILVGGMAFTSLLSAFLLLVSGRAQVVQRMVTEKTHEVEVGRKQLERANTELQHQYEVVKEKEQTFRLAMEHASIGMALVMPDGKFLTVNQALCDLLGYSAAELLTIDFQSITHPDDLQPDLDNVYRLLRGEAQSYRIEKRYFHKNGQQIWALLSVSLVRDADGQPLYFISQIHDITELKQAEFKRQQLIEQLLESNTELEKFAYVASHDMQEPLRMMASFSRLVIEEQGHKLDDEGRQYLDLVGNSAQRMQVLVTDLLEYARLDSNAANPVPVDTQKEVEHVKENLAVAITRSGAEITCESLPQIRGSAVQFASLMQNIISNALKYQAPGNRPVIHISARAVSGFWEFSIRDNGIGIDKADLERIFEPFTRLHSWQQYQGSGMGLAICRRIVESCGGRMWATSEPGRGSTFYFTIKRED